MKQIIFLTFIAIFFFGCAPLWKSEPRWEMEEKAINRSTMSMVESEIAKGEFKSRLYTKPVVQKVKVTAMIRGGVYIPEHWEYVIIQPGEYVLNDPDAIEQGEENQQRHVRRPEAKSEGERLYTTTTPGFDIKDLKKIYGIPDRILPVFLANEGADVLVIVYNINVKVVDDIAVVNLEKAGPLINEQTTSSVYIVSNDQMVNIGKHSYIFVCSYDFVSVLYSASGRTVSVKVTESNAFVTGDGLLVRSICVKGRI
ncbi:MAG: hypothetical protein IBX72_11285 [Nitrospirae bacterium]|nr:hypothetical protein [Nitrospirota bacterium]